MIIPYLRPHIIKRFFFHIAYNGCNYHGWQRQSNACTVQEVIEGALLKILKMPTSANGCGRTDAGVHASQYFFHADLAETAVEEVLFKLNHALPANITVLGIIPVSDGANARFDATQRTYDYFIHLRKDPFLQANSALYQGMNLDIQRMQTAVDLLPQYEDYYAFCKSPASFKHTICRVSGARFWVDKSGERLRFQVSANRFLTGMIRIIVGRLLEIGAGKMSMEAFEGYLRDKKTPPVITGAYPQGLYLSKVVYPYLELPQQTVFGAVFGDEPAGYWI